MCQFEFLSTLLSLTLTNQYERKTLNWTITLGNTGFQSFNNYKCLHEVCFEELTHFPEARPGSSISPSFRQLLYWTSWRNKLIRSPQRLIFSPHAATHSSVTISSPKSTIGSLHQPPNTMIYRWKRSLAALTEGNMTAVQHGSQTGRKRGEMDLCLFSIWTQNEDLQLFDDLELQRRSLQAPLIQENVVLTCFG